jgi:hypothetical protein
MQARLSPITRTAPMAIPAEGGQPLVSEQPSMVALQANVRADIVGQLLLALGALGLLIFILRRVAHCYTATMSERCSGKAATPQRPVYL